MFLGGIKMENKENENKYKAQIKHLRSNYKRITIDFKIDELERFKEICKFNNTTPTTQIKQFVKTYIESNS